MQRFRDDFNYIHQKTTKVLIFILLSKIKDHTLSIKNEELRERLHEKRLRKTNLLRNWKSSSRRVIVISSDNLSDNRFLRWYVEKALKKIRMLQKVIDLLIFKLFFQRVIKKLMQNVDLKKNISIDLKIQRTTIDVLQKVVEEFLMKSFKSKYILLIMIERIKH
jgi:histone H3/H4